MIINVVFLLFVNLFNSHSSISSNTLSVHGPNSSRWPLKHFIKHPVCACSQTPNRASSSSAHAASPPTPLPRLSSTPTKPMFVHAPIIERARCCSQTIEKLGDGLYFNILASSSSSCWRSPATTRCILRIRPTPTWAPEEDATLACLTTHNYHHWHCVANCMSRRSSHRWRI
jgi:hypothetical protein